MVILGSFFIYLKFSWLFLTKIPLTFETNKRGTNYYYYYKSAGRKKQFLFIVFLFPLARILFLPQMQLHAQGALKMKQKKRE